MAGGGASQKAAMLTSPDLLHGFTTHAVEVCEIRCPEGKSVHSEGNGPGGSWPREIDDGLGIAAQRVFPKARRHSPWQ